MSSGQLSNGDDYRQWNNTISDEQMTYLMNIELLNKNEMKIKNNPSICQPL